VRAIIPVLGKHAPEALCCRREGRLGIFAGGFARWQEGPLKDLALFDPGLSFFDVLCIFVRTDDVLRDRGIWSRSCTQERGLGYLFPLLLTLLVFFEFLSTFRVIGGVRIFEIIEEAAIERQVLLLMGVGGFRRRR